MHRQPHVWRVAPWLVALVLGVVAHCVLPRIGVDPGSFLLAAVRGALTGSVVALTLGQSARAFPALAVSAASAVGGTAILGITSVARYDTGFVGLAVATAVCWILWKVIQPGGHRAATVISLGIASVAMLVASGYWGGPVGAVDDGERRRALLAQPQPGHYAFDGFVYLRTLDLMKHEGRPFYTAFADAVHGQVGMSANPLPSPFNFREPFLFFTWKVLPGDLPIHLLGWFVAFAVGMQLCSYFIADRLARPGPALMAPLLLIPYLSYFMRHTAWFTMMEIWAAGFAMAGLVCLLRGRWLASLILLTAAVATRELMILLVPAWVLAWWLWQPQGRRRYWFPTVAVLGPLVVLGVHLVLAPATGGPDDGVGRWLTGPDLGRLQEALTFAWAPMTGAATAALVVPVAALAGPPLTRTFRDAAPLVCLVMSPLLFLCFFSSGPFGAYWGAILVPLAISVAPSALTTLLPVNPSPPLGTPARSSSTLPSDPAPGPDDSSATRLRRP